MFKSLLGKVDKHSDFEDTQLFRFFKENVPEAGDEIRYAITKAGGPNAHL